MASARLILTIILTLSWVAALGAQSTTTLRLRADSWMPYNGEPGDATPGYVVELLREIFEPQGVKVDYQTLPWAEALAAARAGEIEGVIGANPREGAGLTFPTEPAGSPQMCLMTSRHSKWAYESVRSFRGLKLGVIEGYSYWPGLDRYIEAQPAGASAVVVAGGDNPLDDLFRLLDAGQLDVLVESEAVLLWQLRGRGLKSTDYRVVYKHEPDPVFVAFAPNAEGARFAAMFDAGLQAMRASGRLQTLLRRYGLGDWR